MVHIELGKDNRSYKIIKDDNENIFFKDYSNPSNISTKDKAYDNIFRFYLNGYHSNDEYRDIDCLDKILISENHLIFDDDDVTLDIDTVIKNNDGSLRIRKFKSKNECIRVIPFLDVEALVVQDRRKEHRYYEPNDFIVYKENVAGLVGDTKVIYEYACYDIIAIDNEINVEIPDNYDPDYVTDFGKDHDDDENKDNLKEDVMRYKRLLQYFGE